LYDSVYVGCVFGICSGPSREVLSRPSDPREPASDSDGLSALSSLKYVPLAYFPLYVSCVGCTPFLHLRQCRGHEILCAV